jgi:hypothetical protein
LGFTRLGVKGQGWLAGIVGVYKDLVTEYLSARVDLDQWRSSFFLK